MKFDKFVKSILESVKQNQLLTEDPDYTEFVDVDTHKHHGFRYSTEYSDIKQITGLLIPSTNDIFLNDETSPSNTHGSISGHASFLRQLREVKELVNQKPERDWTEEYIRGILEQRIPSAKFVGLTPTSLVESPMWDLQVDSYDMHPVKFRIWKGVSELEGKGVISFWDPIIDGRLSKETAIFAGKRSFEAMGIDPRRYVLESGYSGTKTPWPEFTGETHKPTDAPEAPAGPQLSPEDTARLNDLMPQLHVSVGAERAKIQQEIDSILSANGMDTKKKAFGVGSGKVAKRATDAGYDTAAQFNNSRKFSESFKRRNR